MKKNIRKIAVYLLLINLLVACKSSLNYWENYSRDGRKSTYLKKTYNKIDSIHRIKFNLCKEREIPILAHTNGSIIFNSESVKKALINSLENHFELNENKDLNGVLWDWKCENISFKNYRNSKKVPNTIPRKNHLEISFQLNYMTRKNIDYGVGLESSSDLGNDIHKVKYKIVLALFKNDILEYMYNQAHWTEITSEHGQKLNYEIPQKVIDSMINLSLKEYYKRLK